MPKSRLTVLPGLDGTNLLLARFCEMVPDDYSIQVIELPDDPNHDYSSLVEYVAEAITSLGSTHVVAESFSGPLGILLAYRYPELVERLTLVATFARSPLPWYASLIPWALMFRLPLPSWVARRYLIDSNQELLSLLRQATRVVSLKTLASRIECIKSVDVVAELRELDCDILYLSPTADRIIPARSVSQIVEANPSVTIQQIDGPHLILQTRPRACWDAMLSRRDAFCPNR
ncbi:MAG: pimeloyl-[acyl-carrier protein] methyl ester esterase [Mariniblastus sp.]|jgi:pimeloyl-[acyl-carrier protein] methyl ester esterase